MSDLDKAVLGLTRALRRIAGGSAAVASLQFTAPELAKHDDAIAMRGVLHGAASEQVVRVVATGTPVILRFDGKLVGRGDGARSWSASTTGVLRFDALKNVYLVDRDGAVREYRDVGDAFAAWSSYAVVFRGADAARAFDCEAEAFVSYPSERGDTRQALWGHVTPYLRVRECERLLRKSP